MVLHFLVFCRWIRTMSLDLARFCWVRQRKNQVTEISSKCSPERLESTSFQRIQSVSVQNVPRQAKNTRDTQDRTQRSQNALYRESVPELKRKTSKKPRNAIAIEFCNGNPLEFISGKEHRAKDKEGKWWWCQPDQKILHRYFTDLDEFFIRNCHSDGFILELYLAGKLT